MQLRAGELVPLEAEFAAGLVLAAPVARLRRRAPRAPRALDARGARLELSARLLRRLTARGRPPPPRVAVAVAAASGGPAPKRVGRLAPAASGAA